MLVISTKHPMYGWKGIHTWNRLKLYIYLYIYMLTCISSMSRMYVSIYIIYNIHSFVIYTYVEFLSHWCSYLPRKENTSAPQKKPDSPRCERGLPSSPESGALHPPKPLDSSHLRCQGGPWPSKPFRSGAIWRFPNWGTPKWILIWFSILNHPERSLGDSWDTEPEAEHHCSHVETRMLTIALMVQLMASLKKLCKTIWWVKFPIYCEQKEVINSLPIQCFPGTEGNILDSLLPKLMTERGWALWDNDEMGFLWALVWKTTNWNDWDDKV